MNWIIPANEGKYNHSNAFQKWGYIDWVQKGKYQIGDIVYIYCTKPYQKVMYKAEVININLDFEDITDDKEFWVDIQRYEDSKLSKFARLKFIDQVDTYYLSLSHLLNNGLNGVPQKIVKCSNQLSKYMDRYFNDFYSEDFFNDISDNEKVPEGMCKSILVNKYERSSIARGKCIEYHGDSCFICDFNFGKNFGKLGEGFIHVHHKIPLSEVAKEYLVDYKEDLIPICPNCHAMLHRKLNDKYLTIEELKDLIKKQLL